ncbi:MAG: 50S ribosomal protein L20 [Candidatus Kerfeldbacteria bacterium]|nr:50S ribosomal protein L20 [Candidatus Kerfeldbacteria bacterium]
MARVKRGMMHLKRRRYLLKRTKGYKWGRKSKITLAKVATHKAGQHAFAHRRDKKANFRRLWNVQLNAAVRQYGLSYSRFIDLLKKSKVELDRKVLSQLAREYPAVFQKLVEAVRK